MVLVSVSKWDLTWSFGVFPQVDEMPSTLLDKQEVAGSIPLRPTKMMARYRVSEGHRLSPSERVQVEVPPCPAPHVRCRLLGRMLEEGDEVDLPEGGQATRGTRHPRGGS
jgi:hypothetical protein